MARVTLITVSYNSSNMLSSMLETVPASVETIIVDNGSADATISRSIADKYGATYIRSEINIGFGPACNLGARTANTEFLFFVNPDVQLCQGAVNTLLEAADLHPAASAFNPLIKDENGKIAFRYRSKVLPKSAWIPRNSYRQDREIPVLSGAAVFVRRSAFKAIGGFDRKIFLYHEDDDLGLRLAKQRGPLRLVTGAEVIHLFGQSTKRSPSSAALKAWYMGQSRVYASTKHGLPGAFRGALLEAILDLISPITLLSPRKRAKHLWFLRGVLAARRQKHAHKPLP